MQAMLIEKTGGFTPPFVQFIHIGRETGPLFVKNSNW
jgi:hypothetical protein